MQRWTMMLALLATLTAAAHFAAAQPPRAAGTSPGDRSARAVSGKSGVVADFNTGPNGETDGLRLDDGTEVRFPPSAGGKLTAAVALHDRVTVAGWIQSGETEIHAATIKNVASGKLVVMDRPPPEVAQGGEDSRPSAPAPSVSRPTAHTARGFVLRSSEVVEGGMLSKDFTGDGSSATLPLAWSGAPAGTRSFALIMHHVAPDAVKWYWVLYNIPARVTSLPKNVHGVGTLGNNSLNHAVGYAPPHSKGPGPKKYTYTLYALSAAPHITVPPAEVSRDVLLAAMQGSILATAELNVIYSRGEAPPSPADAER